MSSEHLSDELLRSLQPDLKGGCYHVRDTLAPGLAIRVGPTGTKRFVLIATLSGGATSVAWRGIGTSPEIPIARARQIAGEWNDLLQLPVESEGGSENERSKTFGSVMEEYLLDRSATRSKSAVAVTGRMRQEFLGPDRSPWLEKPLSEIRERDVCSLVADVRDRPARAAACMSNPVIGVTPEELRMVRSPCMRVLSDELMRASRVAADATPCPRGPFYKAYALTAQRPSEVAGMLWPQIDAARGL